MPVSLFARLDKQVGGRLAKNVMLRQLRDFDWSSSSVGPIERWPDTLKYAARTMLLSGSPMAVLMGRDGLVVYNDAMRDVFGEYYDGSIGRPVTEILPEAADFYRTAIDAAFEAQFSGFHDKPLAIYRNGMYANAWFDLSFTPIADESGSVYGALLIAGETTERVLAVRDLQHSRARLDLALSAGGIVGAWEVDFVTGRVSSDERFARLHGIDPAIAREGVGKDVVFAGIHPKDRAHVMADFDRGREQGDYRCQYRVTGEDGTRWVIASGRAINNDEGQSLTLSGVVVDVTAQVETVTALAESELRFRTYTETLPQIVFSCDKSGRTTYYNQRWRDFAGLPDGPVEPYGWQDYLHPDDRDALVASWQHSVATGERQDEEGRYRHHSGEYRWTRAIVLPVHGPDGEVMSWIGTLTDIHQAKLLETERELVARELNHRIKNVFAVVNGLVNLTLREDHDVNSFADSLRGRLTALNQAHGFINAGAGRMIVQRTGNSLKELVRSLLAPYNSGEMGERLLVEGDDVRVEESIATSLALIFHELATNAAKYGALATTGGKIHLRTTRNDDVLLLDWAETFCRREETAGETSGFGSKLLTLVIERQLRGSLSREINPDGVRILIALPLDSLGSAPVDRTGKTPAAMQYR